MLDGSVADGWFGAAWLGILQGLTEFLPVSSSGHLALFQNWIDVAGDDVAFDVALHVATLIPAVWFYRADVAMMGRDAVMGQGTFAARPGVRLAALIVGTSIPTALIGLGFEDFFKSLFHSPFALAAAFCCTGILLRTTLGRDGGQRGLAEMTWRDALLLGLAQGLAITPGVSRSGTTIATALLLGFKPSFAVKYSFLMSVPAIGGAALLEARDLSAAGLEPAQLLVGFFAALGTGYLALVWLVALVKRGRFASFSWYLWFIAAISLIVGLRGGG